MAKMKLWYDEEGDYLEMSISRKRGYFKDIGNDIWERIDEKGHIMGIAIANFKKRLSRMKREVELPLEVSFR